MRTVLSGYYRNLQYDQNKTAAKLFDVTKQISSGQKIQYAHEDVSTFVDTVRLDNEITTLTQVKTNAQKALQVSTNTDTTMNEMTKILDSMKTKLITAANETNSQESLNAIAAELRGLESSLMQLANTSVDGKYLFSGSAVKTKPIDENGVYQGNAEKIQSFMGSGVSQTYNINGADLFGGDENDTQRKITLNIPQFNQTELYPDIMKDVNLSRATAKQVYITKNDTIRDLMGDNDTVVDTATPKHHFYIRGVDHDGVSFKATINMRDDESVADLMTRIGEAYGNSPSSELVNVTINKNGQIEIEDKRAGSSKLDFHMVANTNSDLTLANVDLVTGAALNVDDLNSDKTFVKSFVKSDYTAYVSTLGQRQDKYESNLFDLGGDFLTQDGKKATASTLLSNVLRSDVKSIDFNGFDTANPAVAVASSFDVYTAGGQSKTMQDLLDAIDAAYDQNVSGSASGDISLYLKDGKIAFGRRDGFALGVDIQLQADDTAGGGGTAIDGLPADASVSYDLAQFKRNGNKLEGNISQILKSDNSYAVDSTKLFDVADLTKGTSNTLDGTQLNLKGININGVAFDASIDLKSAGSTFTLDGGATNYDIFDTNVPRGAVDADQMTYKQLMDVINMIVTDNLPANATPAGTASEYDTAVDSADNTARVSLSRDGKISFEQLGVTDTLAGFSLSDANASDLTADASVLTFQSNNALKISDPKTNFFKQIDEIITSIEEGRIRADGNLDDPRNIGVQNSIQAIDDLSKHLYNQHSIAGIQSKTLQTASDRTDMMVITTKTLRSQTIDVNIADASLTLKQLELNYQAMLSTVSRVSKLSLINYL